MNDKGWITQVYKTYRGRLTQLCPSPLETDLFFCLFWLFTFLLLPILLIVCQEWSQNPLLLYWHEDAVGPFQQLAVSCVHKYPILVQEGAGAGEPAVPHPHPAIPANSKGIPETQTGQSDTFKDRWNRHKRWFYDRIKRWDDLLNNHCHLLRWKIRITSPVCSLLPQSTAVLVPRNAAPLQPWLAGGRREEPKSSLTGRKSFHKASHQGKIPSRAGGASSQCLGSCNTSVWFSQPCRNCHTK